MFSENPGPTALRLDMIQALSFATEEVALPGADGVVRTLAALSGVWNGTKGYIAVLLRPLDTTAVRRFTYSHPLQSLEELWTAIDEAMAFVEGMGFRMDPPEFLSLPENVRRARLEAWDVLRKPSSSSQARTLPPARRLARPSVDTGSSPGGAVLGRVAVVRGGLATRARLLGQF